MTGSAIVSAIIEILMSGITGVAEALGAGLSELAQGVFLNAAGEGLSVFGTLIIVFAGIGLALGLGRWIVNFVTSLGNRNR